MCQAFFSKIERARYRNKNGITIVMTFNNYILDMAEHDIKNYPDLSLWLRQITLTEAWIILDIMQKPNSIIVLLCNYNVIIIAGKKSLSGVTLQITSPTDNFKCGHR